MNKVVISDAKFDQEYDQKIAKKQQAQIDYETQQIENKKNIEKASADAEVRKTQAQAEADARLIAAEAEAEANRKLSESIDSNVLRNKYYEQKRKQTGSCRNPSIPTCFGTNTMRTGTVSCRPPS